MDDIWHIYNLTLFDLEMTLIDLDMNLKLRKLSLFVCLNEAGTSIFQQCAFLLHTDNLLDTASCINDKIDFKVKGQGHQPRSNVSKIFILGLILAKIKLHIFSTVCLPTAHRTS